MEKVFQKVQRFSPLVGEPMITKDRYMRIDVPNMYYSYTGQEPNETLFQHEGSGIITADPFMFEAWRDCLKGY